MPKKMPKFKSIKEEAKFWDTHDITDYLDTMEPVKLEFNPKTTKKESLTIRVQSGLRKKIEAQAQQYGINLSTLIRIWLIDKLKAKQKPFAY